VQLVKNFLPADTAICTYETLKLQVTQNFAAYLWSNNSTGSSIAVTQPGSYWLQVTDSKNCVSRDSITVSLKQQCGKGLYVPTAFTPNGDGRNDQLRAFLLGSIQKFEFRIYNRYGQQVFFTNDVADGWDGKVGGEKQNTGSFVWTCKYQLAGEPEVNERGISTLLR
jgi:gliding motility-associated-like protein